MLLCLAVFNGKILLLNFRRKLCHLLSTYLLHLSLSSLSPTPPLPTFFYFSPPCLISTPPLLCAPPPPHLYHVHLPPLCPHPAPTMLDIRSPSSCINWSVFFGGSNYKYPNCIRLSYPTLYLFMWLV